MNKTFFPDVMSELHVVRSGQSEGQEDFSDDDNSIPLTQRDNSEIRGRLVSYSSSPNTSSAVDTDIMQSQVLNTTGTDNENGSVVLNNYVPDTQTESDSTVSRPRTAQSSEVVPETQSEPEDLSVSTDNIFNGKPESSLIKFIKVKSS